MSAYADLIERLQDLGIHSADRAADAISRLEREVRSITGDRDFWKDQTPKLNEECDRLTEDVIRLEREKAELRNLVEDIEASLTADNTYRLLREACQSLLSRTQEQTA